MAGSQHDQNAVTDHHDTTHVCMYVCFIKDLSILTTLPAVLNDRPQAVCIIHHNKDVSLTMHLENGKIILNPGEYQSKLCVETPQGRQNGISLLSWPGPSEIMRVYAVINYQLRSCGSNKVLLNVA